MRWATPEQRRGLGQARRKRVGRREHGALDIGARPRPALDLLARAERGRLPGLLAIKHGLMARSPFAFFRGALPVMAADLSALPNTGLVVQISGDAHVRNLGAFAAPDGRLVFNLNDFDETICGPFEWDLKRMAASLILAGREAGHGESSARGAVEASIARYLELMGTFASMPVLEVARSQVHRIGEVTAVHKALVKAERTSPLDTLERLTEPAGSGPDGRRRFRDHKPMLGRLDGEEAEGVIAALAPYRKTLETAGRHLLEQYTPVDAGFKVVGTGSVGLRDYLVYLEGNGPGDPLFLQLKEEAPSAYAPYLGDARSPHHNGRRVVEGQRAMVVQSDPLLGWTGLGGRDYLVRQVNDHKGTIEIEDLAGAGLGAFAEVCGELLAHGHARSGDPQLIAGYLGHGRGFPEALADFGSLYADQTEKDWRALVRAIGDRRGSKTEDREPR